jgi:hypothetical protein
MRDSRKLEAPLPALSGDVGGEETRSLIERLDGTMHGPSKLRLHRIETPETPVSGVFVCGGLMVNDLSSLWIELLKIWTVLGISHLTDRRLLQLCLARTMLFGVFSSDEAHTVFETSDFCGLDGHCSSAFRTIAGASDGTCQTQT